MKEIPQPVPLHEQIIEKVQKQGRVQITLAPEELRLIFARQAQTDKSGDLPVLLPSFNAEIKDGEFHLHAPYTTDVDKKPLTFDGSAKNDEEGVLVEVTAIKVSPGFLKDRVVDAFGGRLDLPHFIKLITEDALQGEAVVEKLFIDGKNLGMILSERNQKRVRSLVKEEI